MAQVTVRINGYAYTIGCQDGEEQHLLTMAEDVDKRIDSIRAAGSPRISSTRARSSLADRKTKQFLPSSSAGKNQSG